MATVWQAFHLNLNIDVAIKFLEPRWSGSEEVRSRFAQEATAIAKVRSPHVVHVLDYGFTEQGRLFIVMELLEGEDLGQRLARSQRLGLEETAALVSQACRGLAKAHAANIIHRDIKPENLFVVSDEEGFWIKLLDFGVAKALGWGDAVHQTDTGQIVGTPLYMSPEQALGRPIDARCDLYSLATVAYRCLTGRPPFVAKHLGELMLALNAAMPPLASSFDSSLPRSIDEWFASMFAKDPDARCGQSARDVATSFEAACAGRAPGGAASSFIAASLAGAEAPTLPGEAEALPRVDGSSGVSDVISSQVFSPSEVPRVKSHRGRYWLALGLLVTAAGIGSMAMQAKRESAAAAAPPSDEVAPRDLERSRLPAPPPVAQTAAPVEQPRREAAGPPANDGSLASHAQRGAEKARPTKRAAHAATPPKRAVSDSRSPRAASKAAAHTPPEDKPLKRPLQLDRSSPWQGP